MEGDVADLHLVLLHTLALHAVVDHDVAERACGGDAGGAGGQQLLRPFDVDVLAYVLLHPHTAAAGTTAHPLGPAALRLHNLDAAQAADDTAGRLVDVVVSTQVARVVVDDPLVEACAAHVQLPLVDEPLQELAVVYHLVVAAELWVLVGQRVEAVRALGDDLLHAHRVERLDVLHGQHLEDVLVAGPSGRIARAHLGRSQDRERHPGALHQLCHGPGDLLVLVVERAGAANPVEVLGLQRVAAVDDVDSLDVADPVGTLALGESPRVSRVLHGAVGASQLTGEVRLH